MVDFGSALNLGGFSFGTLGTILIYVLGAIFVGGSICGVIIWRVWESSFKEKIYLWARVNGVVQKIHKKAYKGKWVSVGQTGDKLLYIRNIKKWQLPNIRSGSNEWHFYIREADNELINFGFEDLDEKTQRMNLRIIDGDVRLQRLGIEKNLKERHQKQRDWQQLIMNIAFIVTFIIIFIALVVLFSRLTTVAESLNTMAGSIGNVAQSIDRMIDNLPENEFRPTEGDTGTLIPAIMMLWGLRKWR